MWSITGFDHFFMNKLQRKFWQIFDHDFDQKLMIKFKGKWSQFSQNDQYIWYEKGKNIQKNTYSLKFDKSA